MDGAPVPGDDGPLLVRRLADHREDAPSVAGPTGMAIGPPVLLTGWPRRSPSVLSMATARTVSSPRSWATSSTRLSGSALIAGFVTVNAVNSSGSPPEGNCTSTTGPITCVMRPVAGLVAVIALLLPTGYFKASAPLTTSISSLVIAAWRLRLY